MNERRTIEVSRPTSDSGAALLGVFGHPYCGLELAAKAARLLALDAEFNKWFLHVVKPSNATDDDVMRILETDERSTQDLVDACQRFLQLRVEDGVDERWGTAARAGSAELAAVIDRIDRVLREVMGQFDRDEAARGGGTQGGGSSTLQLAQLAVVAETAQVFRALLDTTDRFETKRQLVALAKATAELYSAALPLELCEASDDLPETTFAVPSVTVAGGDVYWEVFDPYEEEAPVCGSLTDDIRDIYRDVVVGLLLYDQGALSDAQWTWASLRQQHWGDHAVDALRALQRLIGRLS